MANTIIVNSGISLRDGQELAPRQSTEVPMTGDHFAVSVQRIAASDEGTLIAIDSRIAAPGLVVVNNLDSTNAVDVGVHVAGAFYPLLRLLPDDAPVQFRLSTLAPYARAERGTVELHCVVLEA